MEQLKPGIPARGSKTGKPIMVLLDLLGRRMCLRVLWELNGQTRRFRDLQSAADTNPAVLNARLSELKATQIVELTPNGYCLTAHGESLVKLILPMHSWSEEWAKTFD